MQQSNTFETTYRASLRAAWDLDSVLRPDQELDFSTNFLPPSLARTDALISLSTNERRLLNQIAAHQYLSLFIIVEQFILPFLLDNARNAGRVDHYGVCGRVFEFGAFLDAGLTQQAQFNLAALEKVAGRALPDRTEIGAQPLDAARWTYIGSGMGHPKFLELVARVAPTASKRIIEAAQTYRKVA